MSVIYATSSDYTAFTGKTVSVSDAMLMAATRDIDEILIGAVYDVDADGLPTDPAVTRTLMEATCAQAQWLDTIGDDGTGTAQTVKSATLGSASYTIDGNLRPGAGMTTAGGRTIGSAAVSILRVAGLLPVFPYTYG